LHNYIHGKIRQAEHIRAAVPKTQQSPDSGSEQGNKQHSPIAA
jgi:hypothetical protein